MARAGTKRRALQRMFKEQDGFCYLCGRQMVMEQGHPNSATRDHVIPKARIPKWQRSSFYHSPSTRKAACLECNQKKGAKLPRGGVI